MGRKSIFFSVMAVLLFVGAIMILNLYESDLPTSSDDPPKVKVALIVKMKYGEYWETLKMGADVAAKELGVQVDFMAPEEESAYKVQRQMIRQAADEGYDGIVLAPSDLHLLEPAMEYAHDAGVPIVLVDSAVSNTLYYRSFATDNYKAGKTIGQLVLDLAGQEAKVGIINFVSGSENAIEREKGLRDFLSTYESVVIRDTMYSMSDVDLAAQITDFMLNELRPPDVIVGLNAISTLGIAQEMSKYAEEDQIPVIGFDSTKQEIEYLESGVIDHTIVQNPFSMGYLGVKEVVRASQGFSLRPEEAKDVQVETVIIHKDNLYEPENEKLVFPFTH